MRAWEVFGIFFVDVVVGTSRIVFFRVHNTICSYFSQPKVTLMLAFVALCLKLQCIFFKMSTVYSLGSFKNVYYTFKFSYDKTRRSVLGKDCYGFVSDNFQGNILHLIIKYCTNSYRNGRR